MAEESILSDELVRQLISVGEVDILVGLPTFNDAQTVGQVVQVIRTGLLKYFPRERAAILNADGGSTDETTSWAGASRLHQRCAQCGRIAQLANTALHQHAISR